MPRTSNKAKVNTINVMRGSTAAPAPAPAVAGPTLFDSMKQGFGFGVGSSIARNLFESRPTATAPATAPAPAPAPAPTPTVATASNDPTREFKQCMERTFNNYETCEIYLPSAAAAAPVE